MYSYLPLTAANQECIADITKHAPVSKRNLISVNEIEASAEQDQFCDSSMSTCDESVTQSDYYTIALLGRSGVGKSTTGNKLLKISDESKTFSTQWPIKEWRCSDPSLLKYSSDDEPRMFKSGGGAKSVTTQCQMLSNEQTKIRVLDIPGFADSEGNEMTTIDRNAGLIDAVALISKKLNVGIHCILYFLPNRGVPERSDAYCQDEIKTLYHYYGAEIFHCMVMIATKSRKEVSNFDDDDYEQTRQIILYTMKKVTKNENPICPPVLYIPFNASADEVLQIVLCSRISNKTTLGQKTPILSYDSGNMDFDKWIEDFELAAAERSLDDNAKLAVLTTKLSANARVKLIEIWKQGHITYGYARSEIRKNIYLELYNNRMKKNCEQWKDFAAALCTLANKACPDKQHDMIEVMVRKKIVEQAHILIRHLDFADDLCLDSVVTIITAREVIPVQYTGDDMGDEWELWIARFNDITKERCFGETKVQWLRACLAGKALEIFVHEVSEEKWGDYQWTMETFCEKFYSYTFNSSSRQPSQKWDQYANKLIALAEKGFPNVPTEIRDEIVRQHILKEFTIPSLTLNTLITLEEMIIFIAATSEIPDAYTDETGETWRDWLTTFEIKCGINNPKRLQWLKYRISKNLLRLFEDVCEEKDDYRTITVAFVEALQSREKFKLKKKKDDEDWDTVCKDLYSMAEKFVPKQERDTFVLNKLLELFHEKGINLPKIPKTCEEALDMLFVIKEIGIGTYSIENDWEEWLKKFEHVLKSKEALTDNVKIILFKNCLNPKALELFVSLPAKCSFEEVVKAYEIKLYEARFQSLTKSICKSWVEFAGCLDIAATKAYIDLKDDERDKKVLEKFLADKLMSDEVKRNSPKTIRL